MKDMEHKHPHLRQNQRERQEEALQEHGVHKAGLEFATPEELLRFDAAQTTVPASVAGRLEESVSREPRPARSWWQRWFS
jgi:hypothetical protein